MEFVSDKIDVIKNLIERAREEVNALNSKGWYFHNHQFIFNPIISDTGLVSIGCPGYMKQYLEAGSS